MGRRAFTPEFRNESASLVLDDGYTTKEAANTVGIGLSTMERWVSHLKKERQGITPTKGKAITAEHRRIQELEAKIRKIEREKEILKKATALLMSESSNQ